MKRVEDTDVSRLKVAYTSVSRLLRAPLSHAVDPANPLWNGRPGRSRQRAICGATVAEIGERLFEADAEERPCKECSLRALRDDPVVSLKRHPGEVGAAHSVGW